MTFVKRRGKENRYGKRNLFVLEQVDRINKRLDDIHQHFNQRFDGILSRLDRLERQIEDTSDMLSAFSRRIERQEVDTARLYRKLEGSAAANGKVKVYERYLAPDEAGVTRVHAAAKDASHDIYITDDIERFCIMKIITV